MQSVFWYHTSRHVSCCYRTWRVTFFRKSRWATRQLMSVQRLNLHWIQSMLFCHTDNNKKTFSLQYRSTLSIFTQQCNHSMSTRREYKAGDVDTAPAGWGACEIRHTLCVEKQIWLPPCSSTFQPQEKSLQYVSWILGCVSLSAVY